LRHFAVELEELNQALLEMGALVESSIHCSVQSLVDRDERMALRVIEDENRINRMELDIDARVTRLLALNQPVAGAQNQHRPGAHGRPSRQYRRTRDLFG
jgi:phosphate transport system protein